MTTEMTTDELLEMLEARLAAQKKPNFRIQIRKLNKIVAAINACEDEDLEGAERFCAEVLGAIEHYKIEEEEFVDSGDDLKSRIKAIAGSKRSTRSILPKYGHLLVEAPQEPVPDDFEGHGAGVARTVATLWWLQNTGDGPVTTGELESAAREVFGDVISPSYTSQVSQHLRFSEIKGKRGEWFINAEPQEVAEEEEEEPTGDLEDLSVKALRKLCEEHDLDTDGKKKDLIARLSD